MDECVLRPFYCLGENARGKKNGKYMKLYGLLDLKVIGYTFAINVILYVKWSENKAIIADYVYTAHSYSHSLSLIIYKPIIAGQNY